MKIKRTRFTFEKLKVSKQKLLRMKLTLALLLCMIIQSFAGVYSQTKISLDTRDHTISEIFKIIEQQTGYYVIYGTKDLNPNIKVRFNMNDVTIEQIMEAIIENKDLSYTITENYIAISKEENSLEAQDEEIEIKGKVTDSNGVSLPGATVLEAGTLNGVTTNENGEFKLTLSSKQSRIKVSFIGFTTQTITIGEQTTINVVLKESAESLEEVVVVGYGTQKKERIGSSVSQVTSKDIEDKTAGTLSFEQILGGQIKGVQIQQNSGAPGAEATIRIRGITSPFAGGNNQPLYVVDGVPFNTDAQFDDGLYFGTESNPLLSIDPNDIETFTVLKDAAATAIYGSRGANGVILITTKRGRKNSQIRTSVQYSLTISNPIKTLEVLDADGFKALHKMIAQNTIDAYAEGTASRSGYNDATLVFDPGTGELRESMFDYNSNSLVPLFGNGNTDWQNLVYDKDVPVHQWNVNMSGGTKDINFSLGANLSDQKTLIQGGEYKRYGVRLGLDAQINKWLKVGSTMNYSGTHNFSTNNTQSGYGIVNEALVMNPTYNPFNDNGDFTRFPGYIYSFGGGNGLVYSQGASPLAKLENEIISKTTNFIGNVYAEFNIITGLTFRADVNTSVFKNNGRNFRPLRATELWSSTESFLSNSYAETVNTSLNLQANYEKKINKHYFNAMIGASWDRSKYDRRYEAYAGLADDYVLTNASSAGTYYESSDAKAYSGINSIYSRIQYTYNDKYTATINFRTDKSSKFGPGNQIAYFPSLALNWNMHREDFMKGVDFVHKLNLRASYGKSGSANIADFAYLQFFEVGLRKDADYGGNTAIIPSGTLPNQDIKWETTKELNVGVDFSLFDNKLYGSFDYYNKYTDGILIASPYPQETGSSSYTSNLAEVSNRGWEFELGTDIIRTQDFSWDISFNISANRNKVENMEGHALPRWSTAYFTVGEPIGTIKGYRVEGIIQTQEQINALNAASPTGTYYLTTTAPGDYLYKDINGDGMINSEDSDVIGSSQPDYFGGINTTFRYKRFSLNASFQYSIGNETQWQNYGAMIGSVGVLANASPDALNNTWTSDNTDAKYPRLIYRNRSNLARNDRDLQDASYLKLKVLRLNYNFPEDLMKKLSLRGASIYVSATNLFTLTKYQGVDPEGGFASPTGGVTNRDIYPFAKSITFGVKLDL